MATTITTNTFSTTYKDDFKDSDNFHRILFNGGKALQARELTQMQTIIQKEIERLGSNLFRDGGVVQTGGMTINNKVEFIKLATNALPADPNDVVGEVFSIKSPDPAVEVKVIKAVAATGGDPDTIYVEYVNTSAGTSGTAPVRVGAGQVLEHATLADMTIASSGATGQGTEFSIAQGSFFVQGHFVFNEKQTIFVDKYSSTPNAEIGFKVTEDVVTEIDNSALYDNQGATPNLASPGAHRYRIRLTLIKRSDLTADDNFVYVTQVSNGKIVDEVRTDNAYNTINDVMALRTKEESGDYIVKPFIAKYNTLNDSNLQLEVSDGIAYVDGYRIAIDAKKITVPKATETVTNNNETVVVQYGNYVLGSGNKGLPNINEFAKLNLRDTAAYGGSTIGSARVRAVEEDGANYRYYLFDIRMNSGKSFSQVKSIGIASDDYFDLVLESSAAVLKSTGNNDLLFPLPNKRPTQTGITADAMTVQRRYTFSTNGSGAVTGAPAGGPGTGYTFTNTSQWIMSALDSDIDTGGSITLNGTQTAFDITGLGASKDYEVLAQVTKASPTSRTKNLQNTTLTVTWPDDKLVDDAGNDYIPLKKTDIFSVESIKVTDSDGADLSTNFTLDNGQRDNYYGFGRLVAKGGVSIPNGSIFTRFKHFTHTSGDFFSVNSYQAAQVPYAQIPTHRMNNGQVVDLRDVVDFRPVAVGADSNFSFDSDGSGSDPLINFLPQNTGTFTADIEYHKPRADRLVAATKTIQGDRIPTGELRYIQGVSSFDPQLPQVPEDAMALYNFTLGANTLNESDTTSTLIPAKRFTMADIGELENRIDELQELTTLSLLELNTSTLTVVDSAGNERTKAGFLADGFQDYTFSATNRDEYRAVIDRDFGNLTPVNHVRNTRLVYDSADANTTTERYGDFAILPISSEVALIDQNDATETENINPFAVIVSQGHIDLSPQSDEWVDTEYAPDNIVDGGEIQRQTGSRTVNSLASWRSNWIGRPSGRQVLIRGSVDTRRETIGDRIIDVSIIPFMRSRKIAFRAQGFRRNTKHFAFFGGQDITDYTRKDTTFTRFATDGTDVGNLYNGRTSHPDGANDLTSDSAGHLAGSFIIPNNSSLRFRTGTQRFQLMDVTSGTVGDALSEGSIEFTATGILNTRQRTIRSTRIQNTILLTEREREQNRDPLAQSFRVNDIDNPNGLFITKVRLFFSTKETNDGVPAQVQIRPIENGVPTGSPIPGAVKFLNPADINVPSDVTDMTSIRAAHTDFTFEEPVFLSPGREYAIVVMAESTAYQVYVAKTYEYLLGSTEARVTRQPTMGSLFLSQNGTTWTPDQTRDLMFGIYRADFSSSAAAVLENAAAPKRLLGANPILTDSGGTDIRVFHDGHGFIKNDYVTVTGLDSATTYAGVLGTSIMGSRQITKVDHTGYVFAGDSSADGTLRVGGSGVIATQNVMYDVFVPQIQLLSPGETTVSAKVKTTAGSSYADNRNTASGYSRAKASSFTNIQLNEFNYNDTPKMIASDSNESVSPLSGNKSLTLQLDLSTTDTKVSPVVDLQRSSWTSFENVIDKQDASATNGFNVPISYVAETHPTDGSAASKHITTPVTLEEGAVGLKILFAANRPSASRFKVYYKIATSDTNLDEVNYIEVAESTSNPADEDGETFRQYEYLAGGQVGNLDTFTQFQVKIVMESTNSSKIPTIKDLRTIAMVT